MKLNLKGITKDSITWIVLLLLALINSVFEILGYKLLPFVEDEISETVSIIFLIGTSLYNAYKNRNITTASQKAQQVTDAIKSGELLIEQVDSLLDQIKGGNYG